MNRPSVNFLYPNYRIVQFAKAPEAGKVKTRLQPALGKQGCLQLHQNLVEHCFDTLRQAAVAPAELAVAGEPTDYFHQLVAANPVAIEPQQGSDLGERMLYAANQALAECSGVIIVGSDCPFFDRDYLHSACRALAEGNDCVLGPAHDGGYVLIGMRRTETRLFADVPWGTDRVLDITRQRLSELGWQWHELPQKADIDRPEDLSLLSELWPDLNVL